MPAMSRLAAVLAAALLALAACGGPAPSASPSASATAAPTATPGLSASPAPSATPASSGDTAALYRQIEDQVLAERGLPAKERLEPTILSEAEARTRLEEQFRKDNPPDEIAVSEGTLKALGLLPADASLTDLNVEMLGSQVIGYYDPEVKQLFVVSRSGKIGASEKSTFAHEFTHALQDQSFDLEAIDGDAVGQGDRWLARRAFVEGDAVLSMTQWLSRHLTAAELGELLEVDPEVQAQLERMPAILREPLLFQYLQGFYFANGIWAKGGWEAVNDVYRRLPDSTEQVLHPEKYEAGEKPVEVRLDAAALAKEMGSGWTVTPEDTLGEFQLSVWLRENGVQALPAGAAAAGWGGDRVAYLRGPDGAYALALVTAWDSDADATQFREAAATAVEQIPGDGTVRLIQTRRLPGSEPRLYVAVLAASDAATLDRLGQAVHGEYGP